MTTTAKILEVLEGGEMTMTELAKAVGKRRVTVASLARELKYKGKVMKKENGRWAIRRVATADPSPFPRPTWETHGGWWG